MEKALVDIFTAASIVAAAVFGALGLFTDYKKDGKVTRYGKIAVGGILASALMSLLVNFLQNRLEAEASRNDSVRFNQQLTRLEGINQGLNEVAAGTKTVQGDVERNLRTTKEAAGGVKDSLRATKDVQQAMVTSLRAQNLLQSATQRGFEQERTNTNTVLRTMWNDANRVSPSSLEVVIAYDCGDPVALKEVVGRRSEATMHMVGAGPKVSLARLQELADQSKPDEFAIEDDGYAEPISLFSDTLIYDNTFPASVFSRFISPDLGAFTEIDNWRGSFIEIIVNIAAGELSSAMVPFQRPGSDPSEAEPVVVKGQLTQWRKLPCSDVFMTFLVNGRQFASGEATLYHRPSKLLVRSKPLPVENVPVFALDSKAGASR